MLLVKLNSCDEGLHNNIVASWRFSPEKHFSSVGMYWLARLWLIPMLMSANQGLAQGIADIQVSLGLSMGWGDNSIFYSSTTKQQELCLKKLRQNQTRQVCGTLLQLDDQHLQLQNKKVCIERASRNTIDCSACSEVSIHVCLWCSAMSFPFSLLLEIFGGLV